MPMYLFFQINLWICYVFTIVIKYTLKFKKIYKKQNDLGQNLYTKVIKVPRSKTFLRPLFYQKKILFFSNL